MNQQYWNMSHMDNLVCHAAQYPAPNATSPMGRHHYQTAVFFGLLTDFFAWNDTITEENGDSAVLILQVSTQLTRTGLQIAGRLGASLLVCGEIQHSLQRNVMEQHST